MSRWERYGTRDFYYSWWHRLALPDHYAMIDIDGVEYCWRCGMPLALIETARDVGQHDKTTKVMARVADMAGLPAWKILYTPDETKPGGVPTITKVRFARVTPEPYPWRQMDEREFRSFFDWLHEHHRCPAHRFT
jgi:hypothetical protein